MSNNRVVTISKDTKISTSGFKVVEVNVSNPVDHLYAVCTPIKMK
ncbi:hypothetical protein OEV98_15500 [Caldibacillus lycopersici]|uniref:Uncharacterized protein n=1 Tax=Perspicuibacillus lycopersici TaxID=1325689 RepID=A0AAE3LNP8_9BACI|nr:hypothetical protein [Perspicuibacillus lycopersici]MCU9614950.1 hypothetical protein [Perspicuibacillus lycopersici]